MEQLKYFNHKKLKKIIKQELKDRFKINDLKLKIYLKIEKNKRNDLNFENSLFKENQIKFKMSEKYVLIFILKSKSIDNKVIIDNEKLKIFFTPFKEIMYMKLLESKLKKNHIKDKLTNVYNRKILKNYIKDLINLNKRENKKIAFCSIGIDHFKAVIDEFDYDVGDKVIVKLVESIKKNIRNSDLIFRLEQDEFLLILQNVKSENNVIMIINKIIDTFSKMFVKINEESELKKTMCSGILLYPETEIDEPSEIIRKANISLYEAKNLGRNKCYIYKEEEVNTIDLF